MSITAPSFDQIKNAAVAEMTARLYTTVAGTRLVPDFGEGSVLLTLSEVIALVLDSFYGQLLAADATLRLGTATGTDLESLVALLGVERNLGSFALVPVKFTRATVDGSTITIPTGKRVLARDQLGNTTLAFVTVQGAGLALGVAGTIAGGAADGWAWVQATEAGRAGNISAGQIALLGDPISGVDFVSNPQVTTPLAPTVVSNAGSGTTYRYALAAHGVGGQTPVGARTTVSGGVSPNNTISWTAIIDAASIDVLVDSTPLATTPSWQLLQNVAGTATSVVDSGQGRSGAYSAASINTTNTGSGGVEEEEDDDLRARAPQVLYVSAKSTSLAVQDAVLAVPGVSRVFVRDAGQDGLAAGNARLYVQGDSSPLSATVISAVNSAITATKAAGITITWSEAVPSPVTVTYTAVSDGSVSPASSLAAPIATALQAYFDTLVVGNGVALSGVMSAIQNVPAIVSVTSVTMVALGTTYNNASVPGQTGVLFGLGTITSTIS
jgi:uncharacterized phage protein gp47/JayE